MILCGLFFFLMNFIMKSWKFLTNLLRINLFFKCYLYIYFILYYLEKLIKIIWFFKNYWVYIVSCFGSLEVVLNWCIVGKCI